MKQIKRTCYFLILSGIFFLAACKEKPKVDTNQLQLIVESEISENNPGMLVSITSPNFNWTGFAGYSDKNKKESISINQTFRIASVTKTFVAATILRLWEDGKLNLDDPICKYIAKAHCDTLRKGGYDVDTILIRHLLTHTSGMAEHTNSYKYDPEYLKTRHKWTRTEQINDLIKYAKPVGKVGEKFSYSDTGYLLLGETIEKITGQDMGTAIEEQLQLKKLGLNNTHMEDYDGDFSGNRIHQYHDQVDTYYFHPSLDYFGGGGLLSIVSDLSLFFQCLLENKIFQKASTLQQMLQTIPFQESQSMDYRMGIWRIELNGQEAYTHSGFWGTQVAYVPKMKMAIAINYSQHWPSRGTAPILKKLVSVFQANVK